MDLMALSCQRSARIAKSLGDGLTLFRAWMNNEQVSAYINAKRRLASALSLVRNDFLMTVLPRAFCISTGTFIKVVINTAIFVFPGA